MKIQVLKNAGGKVKVFRSVPVSGGDPTRGGEEVDRRRCYTGSPGRAIQPGRGRQPALMPATLVRASVVIVAAIAAACAACSGDARGVPSSSSRSWSGSACSCRSQGARRWSTSPGLFSSEPLVAAAWDGRPAFRLAESLVESEDGRQLDRHAAQRHSLPHRRSDSPRRSCATFWRRRSPRLPRRSPASWRSTIGACSSPCTRRRRSSRKTSARCSSTATNRNGSGCAPAPSGSSPPSRWCSKRFDGYYQGKPSVAADGDARIPDASCGVDGHDAAGSELPPRGQPRRHRLRRSRRRHPRLPAAQALLHRAGLQHAPSGAEAPRGAGRHQRGARSQRARSQCHARARADCRGPVLALSLGLPAGAFPGRVQP